MSYAIETKKRKFDRILESLRERPPRPSQATESTPPLNSQNNDSGANIKLREELLASSKRRRVTPTLSKPVSHQSLIGHYLPSSRAAFLERLETFRHITKWHIPSTSTINAAAWVKRGWICAGVDTVSCSSCSERVYIDLTLQHNGRAKTDNAGNESTPNAGEEESAVTQDEEVSSELYEALLKRYGEMIVTSHAASCPWRKRGCDSSIQRIEGLLNVATAVDGMRSRHRSIVENVESVPVVMDLPSFDALPFPQNQTLLQLANMSPDLNAKKLAMCGWQYKEADVVECKHCFRSLGLWLYRGDNPTVENLDAVDSHLEYCPWRSSEAQDTDLTIPPEQGRETGTNVKVPGWMLVYLAAEKDNTKRGRHYSTPPASVTAIHKAEAEGEYGTAEQREKRTRDLIRRIKELKKPFNVTSLLRKKDRSDTS